MMKHAEVADLLEQVADYIEAIEGDHQRRKQAACAEKVQKVAEAYEESTGEQFPETLRNKLASADDALLDLLVKQARTAGGSPDSLGGPAETDTQQKVASASPEDRFLAWVNG